MGSPSRVRRLRAFRAQRAAAAVIVTGLALASPHAAAAADELGDGAYIEYVAAEITTVTTFPDSGESVPETREGTFTVRVVCEVDECVVYGFEYVGLLSLEGERRTDPIPVELVGGAATMTVPGPGLSPGSESCADEMTVTVAATAQQIVLTTGYPPTGTALAGCAGSTRSLVGTYVAGNTCVLDGQACPTVAELPPVADNPEDEPSAPGPGGASSVSSLASGSWTAPSTLSGLPTVAEAPIFPTQLALSLLVTLILLILVALPTALLNSASEQLTERFGDWRGQRRAARAAKSVAEPAPDDAPEPQTDVVPRHIVWRGWPLAALTVLAAALISAFSDPEFGLNPGSLRLIASIAIGFAIEVVLGWTVVVLLVRRLAPGRAAFEAKPVTLLVVVGAVVLTRLTGFEPGVLFGVVAGVAFAGLTAAAQRARPVLIALGYAFVLALLAWLGYSVLVAAGAGDGASIFAIETLAAVAASGIAALPIALVPLRGLPGHAVWVWNRWVWVGCYAVGLFAFFFVLMPMPPSWGETSWPLWGWIGAYAIYAVAAVCLWAIAARPWRGTESGDPALAEPEPASAPAAGNEPTHHSSETTEMRNR